MPTPHQVLENNDLSRCISEQRDIGLFRWLPDTVALDPTGIEFVQYELGKLYQTNGIRVFPCELTHDPSRPRDAHAMQIRTAEYLIGYVPDRMGNWWQQQFDLLDDPHARLVGLCRIELDEQSAPIRYRPVCQFRVQMRQHELQTA